MVILYLNDLQQDIAEHIFKWSFHIKSQQVFKNYPLSLYKNKSTSIEAVHAVQFSSHSRNWSRIPLSSP